MSWSNCIILFKTKLVYAITKTAMSYILPYGRDIMREIYDIDIFIVIL